MGFYDTKSIYRLTFQNIYDRVILKWGASSAPVYSYVSAGLFGLVFYLFIFYKMILFSFDFLIFHFRKKITITKHFVMCNIYLFILFALFIRSFVEISFAYWGVDQLIFISLFIFYEKFAYKKLNKF